MSNKRPGRRPPPPTPEAKAEHEASQKKSGMLRLAFMARQLQLSPEQTRILKRFMVPHTSEHPAGAADDRSGSDKPSKKKLPTEAPELWAARDLNLRENPSRFIFRVYRKWLGEGLERSHLASLDPPLYKALSVWLTRNPDDTITALLPSKKKSTSELIDRLSAEYPLDDLRKLGYAIDARMRRGSRH